MKSASYVRDHCAGKPITGREMASVLALMHLLRKLGIAGIGGALEMLLTYRVEVIPHEDYR